MLSFWKPTIPPLTFKKLVNRLVFAVALLTLGVVFASAFTLAPFLVSLSFEASAAADSFPELWAFLF